MVIRLRQAIMLLPSEGMMEYFDIHRMLVNLQQNGAGETRGVCCSPPATQDFRWRASIASVAANDGSPLFPGIEHVITLLEGGEVTLEETSIFTRTLKQHQPSTLAGDKAMEVKLTKGWVSMDSNIMTQWDVYQAKVRVVGRASTTFDSHDSIMFVISGTWQLDDKLLTAGQDVSWHDGKHTLRLLEREGKLLFNKINWMPGHPPDAVQ